MLLASFCLCATSVCAQTTSIADTLQQSPWVDYSLSVITEGQWNMTHHRGGWANRLDAVLGVRLWRDARFEASILSTFQPTDAVADVCQDFSNINAPNRPLRLVHFGLQQQFISQKLTAYVGLRQADEDYFNTPMAGLSTGASCGCVPTVNDNYHINVFPLTALTLHLSYAPNDSWLVQASVYNGNAYDTLDRSFRFRPHRDGLISLGSVSYTGKQHTDDGFAPTYVLGWNFGKHFRETSQRRHPQMGFWLTAEQPITQIGRVDVAAAATFSHQFKDPEVAKTYYNATLSLGHLTRKGGNLAFVFNRAYYRDAHESNFETTFLMPLGKGFSIQPALHHYSTSGNKQWLGQLRVMLDLP